MTNLQHKHLTNENFKRIYTDVKFRNEVAFAHGFSNSKLNFKGFQTCTYPNENRVFVTEEQIKQAKEERERAAKETLTKHKNDLLFVGMGMNYKPRYKNDVCNHRIRTEFLNSEGKQFFIEVGTGRGNDMRIDFAIDRNLQIEYDKKNTLYFERIRAEKQKENPNTKKIDSLREKQKVFQSQPYYNYNNLERSGRTLKYTLQNVLKLVNKNFNCNFKNIVIDYYNISCNGIICESPKY